MRKCDRIEHVFLGDMYLFWTLLFHMLSHVLTFHSYCPALWPLMEAWLLSAAHWLWVWLKACLIPWPAAFQTHMAWIAKLLVALLYHHTVSPALALAMLVTWGYIIRDVKTAETYCFLWATVNKIPTLLGRHLCASKTVILGSPNDTTG